MQHRQRLIWLLVALSVLWLLPSGLQAAAPGIVPMPPATAADVIAGTATYKAVTPAALAGAGFGAPTNGTTPAQVIQIMTTNHAATATAATKAAIQRSGNLLTSWEITHCIYTNGSQGQADYLITVPTLAYLSNGLMGIYVGGWTNGLNTPNLGQISAAFGRNFDSMSKHGVVLSPTPSEWDSGYVSTPRMYSEGGTNFMFYTGNTVGGFEAYPAKVGLAWTTDGTNFTKYSGNPIMTNGAAGEYDDGTCYTFTVSKVGNTYFAYRNFHGGTPAREAISLATASSLTGPWTKHASIILTNPFVGPGPLSVSADPNVFPMDDGRYGMIYRTIAAGGNGGLVPGFPSTPAFAISSDRTNWLDLGPITWSSRITPAPGELYAPWFFEEESGPRLLMDDLAKVYVLRPAEAAPDWGNLPEFSVSETNIAQMMRYRSLNVASPAASTSRANIFFSGSGTLGLDKLWSSNSTTLSYTNSTSAGLAGYFFNANTFVFTNSGGDYVTATLAGRVFYPCADETLGGTDIPTMYGYFSEATIPLNPHSGEFTGTGMGLYWTNAAGSKFQLIINTDTNGFTFTPIP